MSALTGINSGIKVGGGALLAGGVMYGLGITDPTSLSGLVALVGGQAMTWLPDLARRCGRGVREEPLVPAGAKFTSHELAKCVNREISRQLPDPKIVAGVRQAVTEVFSNSPNFMVSRVFYNEMKKRAMSSVETSLKTDLRDQPPVKSGPILCRTLQQVSRIFDDVFNNQYQYLPLDKEGITRLSAVYREFIDQHLKDDEQEKQLHHEIHNLFEDFHPDVDVGFPLGNIETYAPLDGYLQLRPIEQQATKLIIGCGNGRLSDAGGRPNYMAHFNPLDWGTKVRGYCPSLPSDARNTDYDSKYSLKHNHHPKECVTIDATLAANPTIVAFFGDVSLEGVFNREKKFDEIIFEGYFPSVINDIMKSDVRGLLNKGGKVFMDNSQTKEDVTHQFLSDVGVE